MRWIVAIACAIGAIAPTIAAVFLAHCVDPAWRLAYPACYMWSFAVGYCSYMVLSGPVSND